MKTVSLLIVAMICAIHAKSQELAPNQNPNYKESLVRYQNAQDKLSATMNTTVQNTYKAYDWNEAKQERKQQRINNRQARSLARINNNSYLLDYLFWTPNLFYHRYWY